MNLLVHYHNDRDGFLNIRFTIILEYPYLFNFFVT